MASQINNGTFVFNAEELKDWSKVIHELTWNNKELAEIHDIETGIAHNQQIVFAGNIGLMGKASTGCTPNQIGGVTMTNKFWTPVKEDFRLTHCSGDVNTQDKLVNQMAKMNPDYRNVIEGSNSVIGNFLVERVLMAFKENLIRKAWFSDTAAAIQPTGVMTTGTDLGYFNTFNGLFKQIFVDVTGGKKITIAKNAAASYTAQALASGDSIAILKAMYAGADPRLKALPNAKFLVTQSIFDGYLNDLETLQNNGNGNTSINENGQVVLRYRGIEVVPMYIWDRVIASYQDNGTKWNLPHRAVLTVSSNIPLATLATDDFGTVNAFYDQVSYQNYIDGIYTIDAKHLESYLTVVAY